MDELILDISINSNPPPADTFIFENFTLHGAKWHDGALALSNEVSTILPRVNFTWKLASTIDSKKLQDSQAYCNIPVYLNSLRLHYLFSVRLACPTDIPANIWNQRGTCITVWHSQN